ncbi:Mov34/MPN/PAD-1 family protein [Sphingopyxis indica]|uniref:Mov34/MPN/PAD-1 family protein n=1 Tax=Sphingopyxis indica TaxID=436663 RepID=UPI002938DBFA|nr:Mov34/MPN/PAD-1 family protein [Sphingopyxis indica]WOF41717.1 Mov34/MPN/PAD-1 family protein [Sphingopyxis indica]
MTIWLARKIMAEMEDLASSSFPLETGGILLGWRDGNDRIVTGLIGPGPRALHGRHMLLPDGVWQRAQLRAIFDSTGGDLDYLGDWHTHPDGLAAMSEIDKRTLSKIERRVKAPLMAILAGAETGWDRGAWLGCRSGYFGRFEITAQETKIFDPPSGWPVIMEAA